MIRITSAETYACIRSRTTTNENTSIYNDSGPKTAQNPEVYIRSEAPPATSTDNIEHQQLARSRKMAVSASLSSTANSVCRGSGSEFLQTLKLSLKTGIPAEDSVQVFYSFL